VDIPYNQGIPLFLFLSLDSHKKPSVKTVSMLLALKISFKEKKLLIKRIEQLEKEKYEK
jgi:hypothetical protein